jgi:hypothetical protein
MSALEVRTAEFQIATKVGNGPKVRIDNNAANYRTGLGTDLASNPAPHLLVVITYCVTRKNGLFAAFLSHTDFLGF